MTLPRQVLPASTYLVTRSCTQRQFLLRPDAETNNAFLYCLIEAAQRYEIDLLMACALSNHHHTVIHDLFGRYPAFLEHFHKMFARCQNSLLGRWENLWSSEETSVVRLETRDAVIDKVVYAATNPVKHELVERVHHWPGINTYGALIRGTTLRAARPKHFFREDGPMPAVVELTLSVPVALGPASEFVSEVRNRVENFERQKDADRRATGRRVLGRKNVLKQPWWGRPESFEPRRALNPRVAARDVKSRVAALLRNRIFVSSYVLARRAWLAGIHVVFPPGTYWLRRFANVPTASG